MKRRDLLIALALVAVFGLAVILSDAIGSASTDGVPTRLSSERYGFSASVPAGWHHSRARLVPKLLAPREILSLGNFGMPVGGGGNCGREPRVAIAAMEPGDALVTVQEVRIYPALRSHLQRSFPSRPDRVELGRGAFLGDAKTAGTMRYAKLAFSDRGRAFEVLVYVDRPTPALHADVDAILTGLRFQPGSWRRFHGAELDARAARR